MLAALTVSCWAEEPTLWESLTGKFALSGQTGGLQTAEGGWDGSAFVLKFGPRLREIQFEGSSARLKESGSTEYAGTGGKAAPYYEYVFRRPGSDVMYTFITRQHDMALQIDTRAPGGTWMPEATWFLHPIR